VTERDKVRQAVESSGMWMSRYTGEGPATFVGYPAQFIAAARRLLAGERLSEEEVNKGGCDGYTQGYLAATYYQTHLLGPSQEREVCVGCGGTKSLGWFYDDPVTNQTCECGDRRPAGCYEKRCPDCQPQERGVCATCGGEQFIQSKIKGVLKPCPKCNADYVGEQMDGKGEA